MRRQLALAYRDGDEIGTHFNGHFCGAGGVGDWTATDWSQELTQFDSLLFHGAAWVRADRDRRRADAVPRGEPAVLYPVLARRGFRYDASRQALLGTWPVKRDGIWSFPLLELPFIGHTFRVVSMDYNFMANQIGRAAGAGRVRDLPDALERVPRQLPREPRAALARQPLRDVGSWAYDHALTRFLLRACRLPEVRCASFQQLADLLDAHRGCRTSEGV